MSDSDKKPKKNSAEEDSSKDSFTIEGTNKILKDALESFETREKGNDTENENIKLEEKESTISKKATLNEIGKEFGDQLGSLMKKKDERLKEAHDRLLRVSADFDNFKKRINRDQEGVIHRAKEDFIRGLLPVLDSFDRTLSLQEELQGETTENTPEIKNFLEGFQLIHRQMLSYLQEIEIVPIEALGKPFDPKYHEALSQQESKEFPPGHVCQEMQRGYLMKKHLLRPSQVVVVQKSASTPASQEKSEDKENSDQNDPSTPRIKC